MEQIARRPKVVFSNANVGDPRYRGLFLVRARSVGQFAQAAGFQGVEWMPTFDWIATPGRVSEAVAERELALHSLHATFRTTHRSRDTNTLCASYHP